MQESKTNESTYRAHRIAVNTIRNGMLEAQANFSLLSLLRNSF